MLIFADIFGVWLIYRIFFKGMCDILYIYVCVCVGAGGGGGGGG